MKKWVWELVCVSVATLLVGSVAVQADSVQDAMVLAANKLVDDQIPEGELEAGAWPAETGFTGSILPGLLETYRVTCNPAYLDVAELAAEYIIVIYLTLQLARASYSVGITIDQKLQHGHGIISGIAYLSRITLNAQFIHI